MPTLKNPNRDGRLLPGFGAIAPGATVEVPDAVAAEYADGANFVRVDVRVDETPAPPKDGDDKPRKRATP